MAHQAHSLPWHTLAANFEQRRVGKHKYLLAPLNKPHQGKQITHFTVAFARALTEFSTTERRKYSPAINVRTSIEDDDDVLEMRHERLRIAMSGLISPLSAATTFDPELFHGLGWKRSPNGGRNRCLRRRTAEKGNAPRSARCWKNVDWWRGRAETTDVLTMWLILGEMETLFKIARYAPETVKRMWSWNDHYDQCGLKQLMERTVDFYIGMNVLYCKPEWYAEGENAWQSYLDGNMMQIYQPERELGKYRTGWLFGKPSGPLTTAELPPAEWVPIKFIRRKDYRSTPIYKSMLSEEKNCHALGPYCPLEPGYAWSIPHWQFFGYGAIIGHGGWPSATESPPADPLKNGGGQGLRNYLKICWEILVRLDIFMGELDVHIDWQQVASGSIADWYRFEPIDRDKWCIEAWLPGLDGDFDMTKCGFMVERFV
ncbi:uncharacterized protein N7446_000642 [Penicillium canescens]|uniref:Uncharacterized protein n=1 Tax=Penicillium canescens TaxID=5083 RepID=A0AAD6N4W6_PENCN|nr:uncharacterized protein N7446_000642 [Penicillium canescens]KAJ6030297.1 hypothetical protein N7460_010563 [Penicillium canescens]KAJ6077706.1 hypothetical protein N7446_000642 [Penicillium canescens]